MKAKLLKIIRERYQIVYYPNGIPLEVKDECMVLYDYDMDVEWTTQIVCQYTINDSMSVKEAYNKLYEKLKDKIYDNYKKYGKRRLSKQNKYILWHINSK